MSLSADRRLKKQKKQMHKKSTRTKTIRKMQRRKHITATTARLQIKREKLCVLYTPFRILFLQLLYFSLVGDVDPVEFEAAMGMSVEDYLASADKKPIATISTHVEDYARALNGYTYYDKNGEEIRHYDENLSQYLEYKFYQYSDWKVLVTVELFEKNENGEFVTTSPDGVVGKFYASTSLLNKLVKDIDRLLNAELIDSSSKH